MYYAQYILPEEINQNLSWYMFGGGGGWADMDIFSFLSSTGQSAIF